MIIMLGQYKLEVDVESTRVANSALKATNQECECDVCQNFSPAISKADSSILDFFERFGLDPKKASEVMQYGSVNQGEMLCGGVFHIVGKIIEPTILNQISNKKINLIDIEKEIVLLDKFSVGFTNDCFLVPNGFPKPYFQMNFTILLPWVMNYIPED